MLANRFKGLGMVMGSGGASAMWGAFTTDRIGRVQ